MTISQNRNSSIDTWRGLAILSVILLHCYIHLPFTSNLLPPKLINIIFRSGYYGVILFFVISGFLITLTSLKRWANLHEIPLLKFYKIRFARIAPCLILLLVIASTLHLLNVKGFVLKNTSLSNAIFSAITFQINRLQTSVGYLQANWDVLWSLSVEEIFYLLFPIAVISLRRWQLLLLLLILIILGPLARIAFSSNEIWSDHSYLSCMDGIAIGCLAAMIAFYIRLNKYTNYIIGLLGIGFLIFILLFRSQVASLGITRIGLNVSLLELGMAMILIATNTANHFHIKPLSWLGQLSYEIYLFHSFVVIIFAEYIFNKAQPIVVTLMEYIIIILLVGLLGKCIAVYFSEPLNRIIKEIKLTKLFNISSRDYI